MKLKTALVICFLLGQPGLAAWSWAAPGNLPSAPAGGGVVAPVGPQFTAYAREGISLDEAVARVRRQTGGRIIKATARSNNGQTVYHIRVLTADGRVFTVRVDAASGRNL